jgi:hypothetical protein
LKPNSSCRLTITARRRGALFPYHHHSGHWHLPYKQIPKQQSSTNVPLGSAHSQGARIHHVISTLSFPSIPEKENRIIELTEHLQAHAVFSSRCTRYPINWLCNDIEIPTKASDGLREDVWQDGSGIRVGVEIALVEGGRSRWLFGRWGGWNLGFVRWIGFKIVVLWGVYWLGRWCRLRWSLRCNCCWWGGCGGRRGDVCCFYRQELLVISTLWPCCVTLILSIKLLNVKLWRNVDTGSWFVRQDIRCSVHWAPGSSWAMHALEIYTFALQSMDQAWSLIYAFAFMVHCTFSLNLY